jgi:endo-1,4-beta-xylanase
MARAASTLAAFIGLAASAAIERASSELLLPLADAARRGLEDLGAPPRGQRAAREHRAGCSHRGVDLGGPGRGHPAELLAVERRPDDDLLTGRDAVATDREGMQLHVLCHAPIEPRVNVRALSRRQADACAGAWRDGSLPGRGASGSVAGRRAGTLVAMARGTSLSARGWPMLVVASLLAAGIVAAPIAAGASALGTKPVLGTAVQDQVLGVDRAYTAAVPSHFKSITPETALAWFRVEPAPGVFNFAPMDKVMDFAAAHGLTVQGMPLLWYKELPAWLKNGSFTRDELIGIMQNHIRTIVSRYAGRISIWHVATEAMIPAGTIDTKNLFYRQIGPDYLDIAYRTTHESDPTAKLYYNDAGNEVAGGGKATGAINLVKGFRARGVPIDGIGLEMHTTTFQGKRGGPVHIGALFHKPNTKKLVGMMNAYASLNLDVAITEMDVRLNLPSTSASLKRQAGVYKQVYASCTAVRRCLSLTMWGFTDKYSWVKAWTRGKQGDALPFDKQLRPKPAASVFWR